LANKSSADNLLFNASKFPQLKSTSLNKALHILLKNAGFNQSQYASHSFRIGATTTAAAARIPAWMIMSLECPTPTSPTSTAPQLNVTNSAYMHNQLNYLSNGSLALALCYPKVGIGGYI